MSTEVDMTKSKSVDVKVYSGYNGSIQVRKNNKNKQMLKNVRVTTNKFGPAFYIQDDKQIEYLHRLSDIVENRCRDIFPNYDYSEFSIINQNNKVRIKISKYQKVDYIDFDGFVDTHDTIINAACLLKISKYQNKLFFSLNLAACKFVENVEKESYQNDKKNDYSKMFDDDDWDSDF